MIALRLLQGAGVAAIYFAAAKVALLLAIPPGYATPVWPSAGIAIAALMRGGLGLWPAVLLGAAAVNFTIQQSLMAALAIGAGNTLEAVIGAALARRVFGAHKDPFDKPVQIFQFFGIAVGCSLVAASAGIASLAWMGAMQGPLFLNWATWWLGDAAGMLIVAPLMLAWTSPRRDERRSALERWSFVALLIAVCLMLYLNWMPGGRSLPLGFAVLPPLAWAALRFGEREVTTACALMAGVTIWQASFGGGPFVVIDRTVGLLLLQTFLGMLVVTSLALQVAMQQLRRTAAALAQARLELQQFVDLAAHDLQEPLRNIMSFSDLLSERHRERLVPEGREFLDYVTGSAGRMRRLIDDLLSASRASRAPLRLQECDTAQLCRAAEDNLRALVLQSGARIEQQGLPSLRADAALLESLFQNLLSNALRYRGEAPPVVRIAARRDGAAWRFEVRDNGRGIEPRYHQTVFQMFERLDKKENSVGTGAGLAICRHIVQRHGGRIWVESNAGGGAAFIFTLASAEGSSD
jgi:signal transduction histidine kinase